MAKKIIPVMFSFLILFALIPSSYATTLTWTTSSNPGSDFDGETRVVQDNSGIYIGGASMDSGSEAWRVEKRSLTNGSLLSTFGTGGVISNNLSVGNERVVGVEVDSSGLYVAGYDAVNGAGNSQWRIEKRNLTDGSLISSFGTGGIVTSNPSSNHDMVYDMAINGSALYVIGIQEDKWRIEKRSLITGSLDTSFGSGGAALSDPSNAEDEPYSIVLDSSAFYVLGLDQSNGGVDYRWRIEKRNLGDGNLVPTFGTGGVVISNPSNDRDYPSSLAVDKTGLYVGGADNSNGANNDQWRIEKRNLSDGSLISTFGNGGVILSNPSDYGDTIASMQAISSGLYIVGYDCALGMANSQFRIEKRNLTTGQLINSFGIGGIITRDFSIGWDTATSTSLNSSGFIVSGADYLPGSDDEQWRIERYADDTYLNTSINLSSNPKKIKKGEVVTLKGQLMDTEKQKLTSQTVKFYKKVLKVTKRKVGKKYKTTKKWVWQKISVNTRTLKKYKKKVKGKTKTFKKWIYKPIKYLTTDDNGKFTAYISPSKTANYKVEFDGIYGYKKSTSKQVKLIIRK